MESQPTLKKVKLEGNVTKVAPRTLKVVDFTMARMAELKLFQSEIQKITGTKRTFQLLPKHLRRRSMSYNIYRIPRRLRNQARKEMTETLTPNQKKKKNRPHKRRPKYALQDYIRRQKENKWLETHIWHAKRMKMTSLWGYKIAEFPRDKGVRAIYKATANVCTIHDESYYGCIEIVGSQSSILEMLRPMIDPTESSIGNYMFLDGARAGETVLYRPKSFPMGALCPVQFQWNPTINKDKRQLWLWVHPAAYSDVLSTLESQSNSTLVVISRQHEFNRFRLVGPRSHAILNAVLKLASPSTNGNTSTEAVQVWKDLTKMRTPSSLPSGSIISLSVQNPRLSFPPPKASTIGIYTEEKPGGVEQSLLENSRWNPLTAQSSMWDEDFRGSVVHSGQTYKTKEDIPIHIQLIQHQGGLQRGFGSGWDVIIPTNWGMAFWISFIYAGARAIGLRESYAIAGEQGVPSFPMDFPDTLAGKQHAYMLFKEKSEWYYKRPASKRPNYTKLKSFYPFFPPWEKLLKEEHEVLSESNTKVPQLPTSVEEFTPHFCVIRNGHFPEYNPVSAKGGYGKTSAATQWVPKTQSDMPYFDPRSNISTFFAVSLVRVSVKPLLRGVPKQYGMICLPTQMDYISYQKSSEPFSLKESVEEHKILRPTIGFVTTGGYSFVRGTGYAVGFCSAPILYKLFKEAHKQFRVPQGFALIRNAASQFYHPVVLTVQL